jgi:hypothetical protein
MGAEITENPTSTSKEVRMGLASGDERLRYAEGFFRLKARS